MKHKYKLKLFGSTITNFYGWIFAGILVFGLSFYSFILMGESNDVLLVLKFGFSSIILLLFGIFGLTLQNYHSKVAKDLFEKDNQEKAI